jgi:hypothetical protein
LLAAMSFLFEAGLLAALLSSAWLILTIRVGCMRSQCLRSWRRCRWSLPGSLSWR